MARVTVEKKQENQSTRDSYTIPKVVSARIFPIVEAFITECGKLIAEPKELIRVVEGLVVEKQEWEGFKTETKKQLLTFLKLPEYGATAKHVISDTFDRIGDHAKDVMATLRIIRVNNSQREIAVAGMLAFLWEFEGSYVTCIDAFCYLLVANGHDLFDMIHQKYVHSLEDIGNVSISPKLKFLEEHNFGIFKRTDDKILRNKIAHHDFILDDDSGKVLINNKAIDIGSRFNELFSFTHKVFMTFFSCLDEC